MKPATPLPWAVMDSGKHHAPYVPANEGMTLRDYFAAKAMAMAFAKFPDGAPNGWNDVARVAYIFADAMLAERAK